MGSLRSLAKDRYRFLVSVEERYDFILAEMAKRNFELFLFYPNSGDVGESEYIFYSNNNECVHVKTSTLRLYFTINYASGRGWPDAVGFWTNEHGLLTVLDEVMEKARTYKKPKIRKRVPKLIDFKKNDYYGQ
jgi:hypothetical protein